MAARSPGEAPDNGYRFAESRPISTLIKKAAVAHAFPPLFYKRLFPPEGTSSRKQRAARDQSSLYAKLPYDAARDFAPVSLVTVMPFLLVTHPALPVKSVKELIALAKARPGQLNYGSPGTGSTTHLANELLKSMTGMKITHIPYKGVAPAAIDLVSGQVQMMSGDLSTLLPHVRSGRMRALAVTSAKRSSLLPDMPTIAEAGVPGYEASGWFGVLVPAGTPQSIVERLNSVMVKGLASPDARERLGAFGGDVAVGTPEQFATHIRTEAAKWSKLIRALGLKAESPDGVERQRHWERRND